MSAGPDEDAVEPLLPSGEEKHISNNGGCYPIWSSNGRVFFIDRDRRINVVSYTTRMFSRAKIYHHARATGELAKGGILINRPWVSARIL